MTKQLSSELQTALARNAIVSVILININGTRYTNAAFDIESTIEGSLNTYEAQGYFMNLSETEENSDLAISSVTITLSALDSSIITLFGTSSIINKDVKIYRVFFDQATGQLVGDSVGDTGFMLFAGRIGGYVINNARETATIQLTVESQFANFEKTNCRRTNISSWHRGYDGVSTTNDYSMEFSHETLADLAWGKK